MTTVVKEWFQKRGLKSFGLLIAGFGIFPFIGFSNLAFFVSGACLALFVYINWQPLKDLSDVDEKVEDKAEEIKELIKKEIEELKKKLIGLK